MPRKAFAKQHRQPTPPKGEWDAVLAEAKAEVARFSEVCKESRETYEQNARTLAKGWDLASAAKGTRYAMKAAGQYVMRKELRALAKKARDVRSKGETGNELQPVVMAQFAMRAKAVRDKLEQIRAFEALPWNDYARHDLPGELRTRVQKSHKQTAATDTELAAFFKAIPGGHEMRLPLIATEFSGARGIEFEKGLRIELGRVGDRLALTFFVESAKCDGNKRGLELRAVKVFQPSLATLGVQRRWSELAKAVSEAKNRLVLKVEPTPKQTVGRRITNACKDASKRANVHVAAYGLRQRVSSQAKASGDAESVALVLGHQTTKTQAHYGRRKRGGKGVSPVEIVGENVMGVKIRGPAKRAGPGQHVKTKTVLHASTPATNVTTTTRRARL